MSLSQLLSETFEDAVSAANEVLEHARAGQVELDYANERAAVECLGRLEEELDQALTKVRGALREHGKHAFKERPDGSA
jgi:hypothetical protein